MTQRTSALALTLTLVLGLAGTVIPAAPPVQVTEVSLKGTEGSLELTIRASGPVQYRLVDWAGKPAGLVVLDIQEATLAVPAGDLPLRHPSIVRARINQQDATTVRLAIELREPRVVQVRLAQDRKGVVVAFGEPVRQPVLHVIRGVRIGQTNGAVRVEVIADGPFTFREVSWAGKPATLVVVDLVGVQLAGGSRRIPGDGAIREVRLGEQGSGVVRLVVDLREHRPVQLVRESGGRRLAVVLPGATLTGTTGSPQAQAPRRAQAPSAPAPTPPPGPTRECFDDLQPRPGPQVPNQRRFTLSFLNERLAVILTAIARLTGVNIVVSPEAGERRLTIRLLNVTLREALDLVTRPLGLAYVLVDRNVLVVPADQVPPEAAVVCHYRLRYARAEDVARVVTPLLFGERLAPPAPTIVQVGPTPPPTPTPAPTPVVVRTQVTVDRATNSLLVVASRSDQARVWEIIRRLDIPEAQPTPPPPSPPPPTRVTRVYRLQWIFVDERPRAGAEAERILVPIGPPDPGAALVAMVRQHAGLRAEDVTFDYRQNAIVVTATEEQHRLIQDLLAQIDVPGDQLLIEASVLDINLSDLKDLGVEWSNILTLPFAELEPNPGQILFNPITRGPLNFQAVLRLLLEQNRARVMANPRVVTRDGQPATVLVGDRIEITLPGTGPQGQAIAVTRTIEVGVRLNITPKINPEGDITLRILTDVSSLAAPPTPQLVHIRTRQAATTLRVQEGSPVVLAGLIQNEERRRVVKVPVLGDIPVIGSLFRSERTEQVNTEIVFIITPRRLPRVLAPPTPAPSPSPQPAP
ncbi:MAG: AMIN domain-containing protein [Armatimonadetes bacterium]|nr:AMIN domain-containing protein [Armatimonadota bacterium]MDW8153264.1 secretin N-terminal domain-containing protein [Armatimonadota bacterium]